MNSSSAKPVNVLLLGNDPADRQWSMLDYGVQLSRHLELNHGAEFETRLLAPDTSGSLAWLRRRPRGKGAAMYFSRYGLYPRLLPGRNRTGLFHILDHGNAGLVRHLDPRRTVVTCHDLIPLVLNASRHSLLPLFSRWAFRDAMEGLHRAARITADSSNTRDDLVRLLGCPAGKIEVVPLGIDPGLRPAANPQERESARRFFRIPEERRVVLHVGNTASYKNIGALLDVVGRLARRGVPVQLVRAGPPLSGDHARRAAELGLQDRITQMDMLPHEQRNRLYHAADLLLYPSLYEGFGLPPLEALACGVPVVVSNRGSLPEIVGDAALVEDPDSPEKMADAAQRMLEDAGLRESMRVRGLVQASKFNWANTAKRIAAIYHSLIS